MQANNNNNTSRVINNAIGRYNANSLPVLAVSGDQFCDTGFGHQDWGSEMGQGTWSWAAGALQGAWCPI